MGPSGPEPVEDRAIAAAGDEPAPTQYFTKQVPWPVGPSSTRACRCWCSRPATASWRSADARMTRNVVFDTASRTDKGSLHRNPGRRIRC
jgi:hypothetical protein